jgi:tubulin polyglutamylase TTLL1/tubulin monoglycylase TTLL3/8
MKTGLQIKDYRKKYEKREIKKEKWIIQKYIANPFLYKGKKLDIRIHLLIRDTGEIYFSKYGYLNVSSVPFKLEVGKNDNESGLIHITNPIYQEKSEQDGNQDDNSISLEKFIEYLHEVYGKKEGKILYNNLLNDWKNISRLLIERTWDVINKKTKEIPNRRYYELIGLDIMIDDKFNSWLIEANFNPGLGNLTIEEEKIVPQMIEETIKICVDPIFGGKVPKKLKWFEEI